MGSLPSHTGFFFPNTEVVSWCRHVPALLIQVWLVWHFTSHLVSTLVDGGSLGETATGPFLDPKYPPWDVFTCCMLGHLGGLCAYLTEPGRNVL